MVQYRQNYEVKKIAKHELQLFYAPACPKCPITRKMLETIKVDLEAKDVKVEEVNSWTQSGVAEARKTGCMTVPCVAIDGKVVIRGVSKNLDEFREQIMKAL